MSEHFPTADFDLPYQPIPRVDERFVMEPESYVDLLLPSDANSRSRLRLFDVNDRWIRAVDLSAYPENCIPSPAGMHDAPQGAFDDFELDYPFFIGRHYNPDNLPILANLTVSREHLSLTVSLGSRGVMLAIRDLHSRNGTVHVKNGSYTPVHDEL